MPPYLDFTPGASLFLAAFAAAFVAMLAFGLIPAWMVSRRDLIRAMKDGGHQTSAGLARAFRLALVGAQVLGCCALLVVAGAMARGLQRLLVADRGSRSTAWRSPTSRSAAMASPATRHVRIGRT